MKNFNNGLWIAFINNHNEEEVKQIYGFEKMEKTINFTVSDGYHIFDWGIHNQDEVNKAYELLLDTIRNGITNFVDLTFVKSYITNTEYIRKKEEREQQIQVDNFLNKKKWYKFWK